VTGLAEPAARLRTLRHSVSMFLGYLTSTLAFRFWVSVKFFPVSHRIFAVAARKLVSRYE
jgi:hypothetical protein